MSDSLKEIGIVIVLVLMISAKGELELLPDPDEPEDEDPLPPPRLPAVVLPPAPGLDDELEDELLLAAFEVDPADTESPGSRLESEAIVPLIGAYSFVSESAVSALLTFASAL